MWSTVLLPRESLATHQLGTTDATLTVFGWTGTGRGVAA